jgi:hypothetical protein
MKLLLTALAFAALTCCAGRRSERRVLDEFFGGPEAA